MNVFLDLDGVMADLEGHYLNLFGHTMEDAPSRNQMWKNINEYEGFWEGIPLMNGAAQFYNWLHELSSHYRYSIHILTAAPPTERYAQVAKHKREWVKKHLAPSQMVLPVWGSESKPLFMNKAGDILIDDWKLNCEAWENEGGVAIKHVGDDFESTKRKVFAALTFAGAAH